MINNITYAYNNYLLGYPKLILFLFLLLLALISTNIPNFKLDASADSLILDDDKDLKLFRETTEKYETSEFLVLTLTDTKKEIFDKQNLDLINKISEEIKKNELVETVTTIANIPLVTSSNKPLTELVNDIPNILSDDVDKESAREEILSSPIYKNLIISEDAKTTAMQIIIKDNIELKNASFDFYDIKRKFEKNKITKNEYLISKRKYELLKQSHDTNLHNLIKELRIVQQDYTGNNHIIRLGGIPMIADDMITFIRSDLINFGIGVLIFIIITLIIIFRRMIWVIAPVLNCTYAVIFMVGLIGFLDWKVTVISSNFISLMLILTLSMNIHIIVRYRQIYTESVSDTYKCVSETMSKMVWPCLYTALTTIVAFASLIFSDIKPVIDFGYMMSLGLITLFITSFVVLPCMILLFSNRSNSIVDKKDDNLKLISYLSEVAIKSGKAVYITSFIALLVTSYGIAQLKVENSFINYFRADTEIYKGMKLIDNNLGGTTPMDIIIQFPKTESSEEDNEFDELLGDEEDNVESNWFTTDKIDKIKHIHDLLDSNPYIGKVLSFASSIRVAEKVNEGKELNSLEMSLLYKKLPDEVKEIAVNPYLSIPDDQARINVRVLDSNPQLRRAELISNLKKQFDTDPFIKSEQITITGILLLYNNMLQSLFDSQIKSLGFVMIIIASMFLILFKSITLMVIGIIPNLLSALFVLGIMGILKIPLDMMTITIAAITIGIAVDNSIHYIYRFREEYKRLNDYEKTILVCHSSIGRAIFFTGITIIFGFSILVLSNFIPTIIFGVLTGLAMFVALIAVLTLLPRLILSIKPV